MISTIGKVNGVGMAGRRRLLAIASATLFGGGALLASAHRASAASAAEIDRDSTLALESLYAHNAAAKILAETAMGVLVFPDIVKGGFLIGGQFGDGVLFKDGKAAGYYRSVAVSYGLQAGAQTFGYALLFMNDSALGYLDRSGGWEVGVGPTLTVLDEGAAASFSTTTAKDDIYAFFFDQKGLMAGIGIQGSKITKIEPGE
jgi:lipid-binding SYLF domain-containing protein